MFKLTPDQFNKSLDELIMFLAQVMAFTFVVVTRVHVIDLGGKVLPVGAVHVPQLPCLPPERLSTVLHPNMRLSICCALILLR